MIRLMVIVFVAWLLGCATGLKIGEARGWKKALEWAATHTSAEDRP